jgi:hypothetical protein
MTESSSQNRSGPLRRFSERWITPYLPYPHFMAVAPLDAVLRMLFRPYAWIPPQYWPRLVLLVFFSALTTAVSLPERLVLAIWMRLRPPRIDRHLAPIFVLGHFRSGTTFLQTLLAADPMMRTPRWAEVLAPQGFIILWTALRYILIPFLPLTGIGEVIPLAPTFPGEDEFALNNWAAASMLLRAVLPKAERFYDRYNDLDGLTPAELKRWQKYQLAFVGKLVLIARGRRLVLKSPAHMARVRHLCLLFPGAKFVHISRPPKPVFQSNLLLWRTLHTAFALQTPGPADEQEELVAHEYLTAEEHYLADRALIPAGDLAEVRLQDLSADPIGEMKRVYRELGLPWSGVHERRLPGLLVALDERPRSQHAELNSAQEARIARLERLASTFGHDRPAVAKAARPPVVEQPRDVLGGAIRGVAAAVACILVWSWVEPWFGLFVGILVWPAGIGIGYAVLGNDKARSNAMGALAAFLTVAAMFAHFALKGSVPWQVDFPGILFGQILTTDRVFWLPIATAIAFWIASGRPT